MSDLVTAAVAVASAAGGATAAGCIVRNICGRQIARFRAQTEDALAESGAALHKVALAEVKVEGKAERHRQDLEGCESRVQEAVRVAAEAGTRADGLDRLLKVVVAETAFLSQRRLPALIDAYARDHAGVVVPTVYHSAVSGTSVEQDHNEVLKLTEGALAEVRQNVGDAARAGVRSVAKDAQTVLTRCQVTISDALSMPNLSSDQTQLLMELDHLTTLAQHGFQRVSVAAGAMPGVHRGDTPFGDIVDSAKGRVADYKRIEYFFEPTSEVWVEARYVEPITMALTELLDNATISAAGSATGEQPVTVSVQRVPNGFAIEVDDRGVGLNGSQRAEAMARISQARVMDVTNLTDPPELGLRNVGLLCAEFGFRVDVTSPSPYGGVRAVLFVPNTLIGQKPGDGSDRPPRRGPAELPSSQQPTAGGASPVADVPHQAPPHLPTRRRREPQPVDQAARQHQPVEHGDPAAVGDALASYARALTDGSPNSEPTEGSTPHG